MMIFTWNKHKTSNGYCCILTVFKISATPQTVTSKTGVGPASFPSFKYRYKNFGKIVIQSGEFQILFWRLILIEITLNFVLKDPLDKMSSWIYLMAWHQAGNKPLNQPTMTKIHDAIWHY